jgi:hypothetical protein
MKFIFEKLNLQKLRAKGNSIFVILLFLISCVVRGLLSGPNKTINAYPDELIYINIARIIMRNGQILVQSLPMQFDQILYPLLISPFTLIRNSALQMTSITIFNAVLMSSVLFPVYLLGKRIITSQKVLALLLVTTVVLPDLAMSTSYMAENLYYPLCVWLFYFMYRFWDGETRKKRIIFCVLTAVFCCLVVITKIVGTVFIIAFLLVFLIDFFFTRKMTRKGDFLYACLFGAIVAFCYLGFKLFFMFHSSSSNATYSLNGLAFGSYAFDVYLIYAFIFNFMFAMIAFFYFPVILPMFHFNNLNKSQKNLFAFTILSFVGLIALLSAMISTAEDFPRIVLRQHARYYAPMLILFLIFFYKQCIEQRLTIAAENHKKFTIFASLTVLSTMIALCVFHFYDRAEYFDSPLLGIFYYLQKFSIINGAGNILNYSSKLLLAKIILAGIVAIFSMLLFIRKYQKWGSRIFIVLILAVCLANNAIFINNASRLQPHGYHDTPERIKQVTAINQYLQENMGPSDKLLVVYKWQDRLIDSYITVPLYSVLTDSVLDKAGTDNTLNFSTQSLPATYPRLEYTDLSKVKYILTDFSVVFGSSESGAFNSDSIQVIHIPSVSENLHIYKVLDDEKIYVNVTQ